MMAPRLTMSAVESACIGGAGNEDSCDATACSGTASGMATLCLRCSFSSLTAFLSSASSSVLSWLTRKLSRRVAATLFEGVPLVWPRSVEAVGGWATVGSTETKEARTFDLGRS